MSTESRLNKLLRTSPVIPCDYLSRFVIMSDCHRGIGNWGDNFLKNQNIYSAALSYYYRHGYSYIELGDGDELWENRSMKEIIATHSNVFELLSRFFREHRLYMLCGNHDFIKRKQKFIRCCSEYYRESQCCPQPLMPGLCVHEGLILQNRVSGQSIFLVHGHQGDLLNDTLWRFSRFLVRYIWRPLELFALNDPTSAAKNNTKKSAVEQRLFAWSAKHSQTLIAGHTHRPLFPEDGASCYFNCGSCVHPHCITALEICNNKIVLVKWSVQSHSDLSLHIGREVLAGPSSIP
ncbi:MAG: serine/threonine protein phosphatase [Dorea sp.]|nr:serine/threonine protein phosphatase [Dorea sp.]